MRHLLAAWRRAASASRYYHATTPEAAEAILNEGFVVPKVPVHGDDYGRGVYLAERQGVGGYNRGAVIEVSLAPGTQLLYTPEVDYAWKMSGSEIRELAESEGYDGIDDGDIVCVFDPSKVFPVRKVGKFASSPSDDPERWRHRQEVWDRGDTLWGEGPIEQTRDIGNFIMHATPPVFYDGSWDRTIKVTTRDGIYVADMFFGPERGGIEGVPEVHPDYRRMGIGTAMYSWAEELSGLTIMPATQHSELAEHFWNQPNRPFGASKTAAWDQSFIDSLSLVEEDDSADQVRRLKAYVGGTYVGEIAVFGRYYQARARGKIKWIGVENEFLRRGVATFLFEEAQRRWTDLTIRHSDDISDDGRAWKRSLGSTMVISMAELTCDKMVQRDTGFSTPLSPRVQSGLCGRPANVVLRDERGKLLAWACDKFGHDIWVKELAAELGLPLSDS